jgi:hypothetical protein
VCEIDATQLAVTFDEAPGDNDVLDVRRRKQSDTFQIRLSNGYDSGEQRIRNGDAGIECKCEVEAEGRSKVANGDAASFDAVLKAFPPRGELHYRDDGPAKRFKLKSTEITQVTVNADRTKASVLGKAKIDGAARSISTST